MLFKALIITQNDWCTFNSYGDIPNLCSSLFENAGESDLQAYARWFVLTVFGENPAADDCVDFRFENQVEIHRNISWDSFPAGRGYRQWFFQLCSEFGWFRTTASPYQPFGSRVTLDFYLTFCNEVYGDMYVTSMNSNEYFDNILIHILALPSTTYRVIFDERILPMEVQIQMLRTFTLHTVQLIHGIHWEYYLI